MSPRDRSVGTERASTSAPSNLDSSLGTGNLDRTSVQELLARDGYGKLQEFQRDSHIKPDGIVGPVTKRALEKSIREESLEFATRDGLTPKEVQRLINAGLNALGVKDLIAVDGVIGPKTLAAASKVFGQEIRSAGEIKHQELIALYRSGETGVHRAAKPASFRDEVLRVTGSKKALDDARQIAALVDSIEDPTAFRDRSHPKHEHRDYYKREAYKHNHRILRELGEILKSYGDDTELRAILQTEYQERGKRDLAKDIARAFDSDPNHQKEKREMLAILRGDKTELDYLWFKDASTGWITRTDKNTMLHILGQTEEPARFIELYKAENSKGTFFDDVMGKVGTGQWHRDTPGFTYQEYARSIFVKEPWASVPEIRDALAYAATGYQYARGVERAHELLKRGMLSRGELKELERMLSDLSQSAYGAEWDRDFTMISGGKNFAQMLGERTPQRFQYDQTVIEGYYAKAIGVEGADNFITLAREARAVSGGKLPDVGAPPPRRGIIERFFGR